MLFQQGRSTGPSGNISTSWVATLDESQEGLRPGKEGIVMIITNPSYPNFSYKNEGGLLANFELSPNTPRNSKKYE